MQMFSYAFLKFIHSREEMDAGKVTDVVKPSQDGEERRGKDHNSFVINDGPSNKPGMYVLKGGEAVFLSQFLASRLIWLCTLLVLVVPFQLLKSNTQ